MLKPGDRVRYTGAYRDACSFVRTSPGIEGWIIDRMASSSLGICYAKHPQTGETAFYVRDLEFAAPAEPEEYETWFV